MGDPAGGRAVAARLAVLMFGFYFGLGAWVPTLSTYLMSSPDRGGLGLPTAEVGLVYSTFAFGGMLAPLVIGLLTDRLFRGERVLGVACLVSAGLAYAAAVWCDASFPGMEAAYRAAPDPATADDDPAVRRAAAEAFGRLFALMLGYAVLLQLAMTLTTVVTLRNLADPTRSFARVRLWGTVGWIAAGAAVQEIFRPATTDVLYLAAAAAGVAGVYAFTLPATPPRGTGRSVGEMLGLPALGLFRDRSFGVFVAAAFVTTAANQFYVVYGNRYLIDHHVYKPALTMTLAQVVEVGCMFSIPLFDPKHRMKLLMAVGLGGYAMRGAVMAAGWVPAVVAVGVPMHGWGYTFFFIVASTYLDREAPPHLRASAQGIITFVSGGVGTWVGNLFAGWVVDRYRVGTAVDWGAVWVVPLGVCVVVLVAFVVLFRPPAERNERIG
ncbi:MAG: MFS transporter [Gemmataceae bacterium]|nr:MFS transporter [Gemmataceae bacterium]